MTTRYAKTHEWVSIDQDIASIGITEFAQSELGDIVFVNLPEVGDSITVGEAFADVESVKAVSDIIAPVSGVVVEINEDLLGEPEKINHDAPNTWFIKVKDISEEGELIDFDAYEIFIKEAN